MSVADDKRPGATAPATLCSLDENNDNFAESVLLFVFICRRLFCSYSQNMLIIAALLGLLSTRSMDIPESSVRLTGKLTPKSGKLSECHHRRKQNKIISPIFIRSNWKRQFSCTSYFRRPHNNNPVKRIAMKLSQANWIKWVHKKQNRI